MKPIKQSETRMIIVALSIEESKPSKKPKINPGILKAIALIIITIISLLNPEAKIVIALIRLLFILVE